MICEWESRDKMPFHRRADQRDAQDLVEAAIRRWQSRSKWISHDELLSTFKEEVRNALSVVGVQSIGGGIWMFTQMALDH